MDIADKQLPVAYFPIPAEDVRAFSDRCMRRANAITHRNAERLSLDMCIIKYASSPIIIDLASELICLGSLCLWSITREEILVWKQLLSERRNISPFAWECIEKT